MASKYRFIIGCFLCLVTAGCASNSTPLVFVQAETLGITANTGGTQVTPEVTLGYRDFNAAVVPVSVSGVPLKAVITKNGESYDDALSVLGQFNASAGSPVSLGKFFATGQAAKRLADGYSHQLDGSKQASR